MDSDHGASPTHLCYKYYWMDKTMDTTIRNLDEQAYRALRARAVLQGRNVGDLLNEAMRAYLARFPLTQPVSSLRSRTRSFSGGQRAPQPAN